MHETAVAWADITITIFEEALEKLHANYSYQLTDSFIHHVHTAANGNPDRIDFAYKYYGKFVDMGVGGNIDLENRDDMVSAGLTSRRQKPWFSKNFFYQVRKLGELFSQKYAQKAAYTIVANVTSYDESGNAITSEKSSGSSSSSNHSGTSGDKISYKEFLERRKKNGW